MTGNEAFYVSRSIKLMQEIVAKLRLNLSGLTVLTEAGSGYFSLTPAIAALANAKKIYAWTRDSKYGKGKENILEAKKVLKALNLEDKVKFSLNRRPEGNIEESDIITNLGFVRPLGKDLLSKVKPGTVVSYMCEKWELRKGDVDIEYCKKKSIKVAGLWENHPDLKVFNSAGSLAIKLCHLAGFEVYQNNIVIWSSDNFGKVIKKAFFQSGASNVFQVNSNNALKQILNKYRLDFIFIADYSTNKQVIGQGGLINSKLLDNLFVIHLCGKVDYRYVLRNGSSIYPKEAGYERRMTRTLAHLGMKPVIDLHAAGLKVGELLYKNKTTNLIQRIV